MKYLSVRRERDSWQLEAMRESILGACIYLGASGQAMHFGGDCLSAEWNQRSFVIACTRQQQAAGQQL